jgi:TatD DNase family protein
LLIVLSYIDTHIHLDLLKSSGNQLDAARNAGVRGWVVPGLSRERWPELMASVKRYAGAYAAPGVHPQEAGSWRRSQVEELRQLLEHPKSVAIGEVGLDRQVASSWQSQEKLFVQMIHLAREMNKPLLIHARQSTGRILEILQREGNGQITGVFHAFSGSPETAARIIDMGFALGIGGVVTFSEARKLPEVVRKAPAQALVLETDAPDMTPEPYRGQPNQAVYLGLVARQVALLRNWSLKETAEITTTNACRILGLARELFVYEDNEKNHEQS